ncbi:hypothetical protein ACIOIN_19275, partial [Streptomyces violaceusniger]
AYTPDGHHHTGIPDHLQSQTQTPAEHVSQQHCAYAPELNPVELLWSSLKKRELANLAGDHLADVADATEQGIHRINANPRLPWSFLAHTGLTIRPPHPPNLRKDQ